MIPANIRALPKTRSWAVETVGPRWYFQRLLWHLSNKGAIRTFWSDYMALWPVAGVFWRLTWGNGVLCGGAGQVSRIYERSAHLSFERNLGCEEAWNLFWYWWFYGSRVSRVGWARRFVRGHHHNPKLLNLECSASNHILKYVEKLSPIDWPSLW